MERLHLHMLRACLAEEPAAIAEAVSDWEKEIVMDDLDYSMMRLTPLLLKQAQRANYKCLYEKRLKVLYKYWWLKSQHIQNRLQEAIHLIREETIPVVVIKGAAITAYYPEKVLRPMADFDLLVPSGNILQIYRKFIAHNWTPTDVHAHELLVHHPSLYMDFYHSIELEHTGEGTRMDLHWRVGNYCSWEMNEIIWKGTCASSSIKDAYTLLPEHELCLMLLHASMYGGKDNLNWIVDVKTMQPFLLPHHWELARQLAAGDGKEAYFHAAIALLRKQGLEIPIPSADLTTAPIPIAGDHLWKQRKWIRYSLLELRNLWIITGHLYPGGSFARHLYQFTRHCRLSMVHHMLLFEGHRGKNKHPTSAKHLIKSCKPKLSNPNDFGGLLGI